MPDYPNDRSPPSLGTVRPGDSYGQDRARQPRNAPAGRLEPRLANNPQAGRAPPSTSGAGDFRGPRTIYKRAEVSERRRSRGLGSFIVYSLVGLVALVVVGITFLLLAPPTDLIRDRLVAEVKARTGRDLVVAGEARFTFVPSLGIKMKDVSLSAPAGMPGPPLLKAARLEVSVALMPLITREVQIDQLVLVKPVIDLRVDANGRRSWDFAEAEGLRQAVPARYAQASPPRGQEIGRAHV